MTERSMLKNGKRLSQQEHDLIERFEAAYNRIDGRLRRALTKKKRISFIQVVTDYARNKRFWTDDAEFLKVIGKLRNVIIHEKTQPYKYLAVPTPTMVDELESILYRLTNPELAIPRFQKEVETVSIKDPLSNVLRKISYRDYSQFPVYDGQRFKGLLTENGITRWLAYHVSSKLSLVELEEVFVDQILRNEEQRENYIFVNRNKTVNEIKELFAGKELLEAVLITESGSKNQELLGIATRWDMLQKETSLNN